MKKLSKIFAVVLVLAMVLSVLPLGAAAAETTTKVTDAATIKAGGNFVLVSEYDGKYYAVKDSIQGKPDAIEVTVSGNTVTPKSGNLPVWTVAACGSGISLSDGTSFMKYSGSGTNFATNDAAQEFTLTAKADGSFTVMAASTNRCLVFAWNTGNYRFGAYVSSNEGAASYGSGIYFFKVSGEQTDTLPDLPTTSGAIVDAIFGLQPNEKLSDLYKYEGKITLTGVVSGSTNWYSNSSTGNVNFKVKDSTGAEKTMQAYKLGKGANTTDEDVKNLTTGDIITVTGSVIKNYNNIYEFDTCELVSVTKGQVQLPALPTSTADIVAAIYALNAGEALNAYYDFESFTLTGVVVGDTTWNDQYGDGQVTFKVDGTDKELLAYQFKAGNVGAEVAKALATGDKVTFTVTEAKNYNGTFEIVKAVLTAVEKAPAGDGNNNNNQNNNNNNNDTNQQPPKVGDNTAIVAMTSVMAIAVVALAVLVIGKKRMF